MQYQHKNPRKPEACGDCFIKKGKNCQIIDYWSSTFRGDILRTTGRPAGSICEQVLGVVLPLKVGELK